VDCIIPCNYCGKECCLIISYIGIHMLEGASNLLISIDSSTLLPVYLQFLLVIQCSCCYLRSNLS